MSGSFGARARPRECPASALESQKEAITMFNGLDKLAAREKSGTRKAAQSGTVLDFMFRLAASSVYFGAAGRLPGSAGQPAFDSWSGGVLFLGFLLPLAFARHLAGYDADFEQRPHGDGEHGLGERVRGSQQHGDDEAADHYIGPFFR